MTKLERNISFGVLALRPTAIADLDCLFSIQLDEEGREMAAFTSQNFADKGAYVRKFIALLSDPAVCNMTIWINDTIAGSIAKFMVHDEAEITYWIDRRYWGAGVATHSLEMFLLHETTRPLYARVAIDNSGSRRVLEKAGLWHSNHPDNY